MVYVGVYLGTLEASAAALASWWLVLDSFMDVSNVIIGLALT